MSKKTGHYCSFCGKDQKDVKRLSKEALPLRANTVC